VESIGEKLRSAREAKKITVRDVVKDTNITPIYIEALEEEDFDKFPSETYLIGFLRSYAEYLKLDAEEMIQAYRGHRIGESVTPLEELTRPTREPLSSLLTGFAGRYRNVLFTSMIVVVVLLIIWGIKSIITPGVDITGGNSIENIRDQYNARQKGTSIEKIRPLQLHNGRGFILLYKNEAVQFLVGKKEVVFFLKKIEEKSIELEILPGNKPIPIEMGKTILMPVEGSPREINTTLKGLTPNRAKILIDLGKNLLEEEGDLAGKKPEREEQDTTSVVAQSRKSLKIIFEAQFTQKSFLEVYLDGNKVKRGFVAVGTRERWEASETIQVKVGNAGGMKARINGKDYIFGKAGQVANKVITWKKDITNPNRYDIIVKDW